MLANNIRDIETDRTAGKITISVRIGDGHSKKLYVTFVAVAYLISLGSGNWLVLLSAPLAFIIIRRLFAQSKKELQGVMERTSMLTLAYSCLLCFNLLLR
jgi:1,4-dihydroxy-2-naphthoate octaprenyltransferase